MKELSLLHPLLIPLLPILLLANKYAHRAYLDEILFACLIATAGVAVVFGVLL